MTATHTIMHQQRRIVRTQQPTFLKSSQKDAIERTTKKISSKTRNKVSLSSLSSPSSSASLHHNETEETTSFQDYADQLSHSSEPSPPISISSIDETSQETSSIKQKKNTPKFFNGCLLLLCFGLAAYNVLSIDQGITRGWSVQEQLQRIPLDNWSSYESSLNAQPIATKTAINVVIYLLGDWLSQTAFVKKNLLEFDALRTLRNGLIGMVFGPLVHEYYEFSDHILPVEVGMNRIYKIFMDQTIYLSVKCSIYIVAVNMLNGESWEYAKDNVKDKIAEIMFTAWKFWPLVHCVTYGVIPARHRILWVNCVDLIWNAILALKTSGQSEEDQGEDSNLPDDVIEASSVSISTTPEEVRLAALEPEDHVTGTLPKL